MDYVLSRWAYLVSPFSDLDGFMYVFTGAVAQLS
jgi:hypothetical protein